MRKVTEADIARTEKIRDEAGPNQETPKPSRATMLVSASPVALAGPFGFLIFSAPVLGEIAVAGILDADDRSG